MPFAPEDTKQITESVTKYMSSTGINHEFWKTLRYSLKCVLELASSASHAKDTPLDWALANVFEDLDFLSHYRAANRIKPLMARSTNDIVI